MNEQFKWLKPSEIADAFRLLPPQVLKTVFGLTDEEPALGRAVTNDDHKPAGVAGAGNDL